MVSRNELFVAGECHRDLRFRLFTIRFVCVPVNLVCASFGHDVHDTASGSPEFGAHPVGRHFEFGDRIDHRNIGRRVEQGGICRNTGYQGFIRQDVAAAPGKEALIAGIGSRRNTAEATDGLRARCQPDRGQRVAADQWESSHLFLVRYLPRR